MAITICFIYRFHMIIINEVLQKPLVEGLQKEVLEIEWYEVSKTILRRKTKNGTEIGIKKNNRIPLQDGDVLYANDDFYVQVSIKPCDCIVVKPRDMIEMGIVCFEIGNMHLPIYIDVQKQVNIAYEVPLYDFLKRKNYDCTIENKKLLQTQMLNIHQIKR